MKKITLSYDIRIGKNVKLGDIIQGEYMRNYDGYVELENGIICKDMKDGRYVEDVKKYPREYQQVYVWDDVEDVGTLIGYIEI